MTQSLSCEMRIPWKMKLVYFCRHVLQRQDVFLRLEEKVRREAEREHANDPDLPPAPLARVVLVDEFDSARFKDEGGFHKPFIVRGLAKKRLLDWSELRDSCGDAVVPVHPEAKLGENWQYRTTVRMKLADAMREMENGAPLSVVSSSQIFIEHAELLAGLSPSDLASVFGVQFVRHEMFVAGPGTGSAYHCAAGGNFFHMVFGRKRWMLVEPRHSFAMYPTIGRNNRSAIFCSPINSDSYASDVERYPLYGKVPKYCVTLEPGDVLFIPSWWWHEVKNIEPAIGIPFRAYTGGSNRFFLLLNLLSSYGVKYLSKAVASKITGDKTMLMTDGIPEESFGGRRPDVGSVQND